MVQQRGGSKLARETLSFLRTKITSGEWPINSRIPKEPELMEILGVGKSTVREAVRSLANLGMLETIRGVGTFVRSSTPTSMVLSEFLSDYGLDQILVYRRALEIEAAQLAAVNRTDEHIAALWNAVDADLHGPPDVAPTVERGTTPGQFHHLIFAASGVPLLGSLYSGVMAALRSAMNHGQVIFGTGHDLRHLDHAAIAAAIESKDVGKTAHAMALHVDRDLVTDDPELHVVLSTERAHQLHESGFRIEQ